MLRVISRSQACAAETTSSIFVPEDKVLYEEASVSAVSLLLQELAEFGGKKNKKTTLYTPSQWPVTRVIAAGVGKGEEACPETWRKAAGSIVTTAIQAQVETLTVRLPDQMEPEHLTALLEGLVLANYRFDHYKEKAEQNPLTSIEVAAPTDLFDAASATAQIVNAVCTATHAARDWVSTPPNEKRPEAFVSMLTKAASGVPGVTVSVMEEAELAKQGFGTLLAVAQGSDARPAMVVLTYTPSVTPEKTVALVGKGVTFDSGGLDLKPPASMEGMKLDMGGAAAVAGATMALARTQAPFRLVTAIPIVENMPSATAYRPGDVFTSYQGKTVEVMNTDAEGRLILIDALSWMTKTHQPDLMLDVATLTGACMIALGNDMAGGFTEDMALAHALANAGEATFERCWPMPMPKDYIQYLKSDVADLRNVGTTRYGGAITAALFLKEFVGDTRWAHIDIAGPVLIGKAGAYCPAGGTGFGVRLLHRLLTDLAEANAI